MSYQVSFTFYGYAVSKKRVSPRRGGGRPYTPHDLREYEEAVKAVALKAVLKGVEDESQLPLFRDKVKVGKSFRLMTVDYYMKFVFTNAAHGDKTNLEKAVEDACHGVVFQNDSQVRDGRAQIFDENPNAFPRAEVTFCGRPHTPHFKRLISEGSLEPEPDMNIIRQRIDSEWEK